MISERLLGAIRNGFALRVDGIHGEAHWLRVRDNGLRLAQQTGADAKVVELFAYLHDSQRQSDGWDWEHGTRAAEFATQLQGTLLVVTHAQLELLVYAIAYHSDGLTEAPVTIQTCWDADRLDLGRIGVRPDPQRLCTIAAKDPDMISWAFRRSQTASWGTSHPRGP